MNTLILQFKKVTPLYLIVFAIGSFALCEQLQAAVDTPDPGGKPVSNTADGQNALASITSGIHNSAFGFDALLSNTDAKFNTAVGSVALLLNDGTENTAVGAGALLSNTTAGANTALGTFALFFNVNGGSNTAVGDRALFNNDNTGAGLGNVNTAVGTGALENNIDGDSNTAVGAFALFSENATGGFPNGVSNNAIGRQALTNDTTGSFNEAMGVNALVNNTIGSGNIAIGDDAMFNSVVGSGTTAVGGGALFNATGGPYIAIGNSAGVNQTTGTNDLYIGDSGAAGESNVIAIGAIASSGTPYTDCFIGGIFGNITPGVPVFIDAAGHLSTTASSLRFKDEIKPMDKASEAIFALKPVTFRYKKEFDRERIPQFGLIAEEVEKVNPDLIARDGEGRVYSVRYDQVNAMLLNEFLKEHKKTEKLEATVASLVATVKEQAAQIQKVSARLELNKPTPQTVQNDQ